MKELFLGFDIGGSKSAVVVGDADGAVIDRTQFPSEAARGPDAMIHDLIGAAKHLLERHSDVRAIGVSIGGPLDAVRGVILGPPNLPGWNDVPLVRILHREFDRPVNLHHDAAACAMAEHRWGAGRNVDHLAYLTCGTGFGVGLLTNGRPHYGAGGSGCEIGHVRYRDDGPTAFGKVGCYEAFASAGAIARLAAHFFPQRWNNSTTSKQIADLAATGDPDAQLVIRRNAHAVGSACALLADLLFIERIILGSTATYLGDAWLSDVRQRFESETLPQSRALCTIIPNQLGIRLQDLSAIAAAMDE